MEQADNPQSDELGDWEDMLDSGELDKRLKDEDKIFSKQTQQKEKTSAKVVLQEDTQRTVYQPQLRILKRDNQNHERATQEDSNKAKMQPKTFAQREAEYLEARQRIMGDQKEQNTPVTVESITVSEKNVIRQPKGPQEGAGFMLQR